MLPLERASKYSQFGSPPLSPSDFEAKPIVLVLGQVGKLCHVCGDDVGVSVVHVLGHRLVILVH